MRGSSNQVNQARHRTERNSRVRCAIAVALLGIAGPASAGLLDGLRAIDINDYAIGVGVSTTESIYAGAGDSRTVYPFLTRLRPSAFDDGVVFSRDGAYGVRWVSGNGTWEAGALAKLQTLGFEAADSELFTGLQDRTWTVEVGPTLGWRGPVHVDWTAFVDLLRNHRGSNHAVRLSVPRQFPRGYVIPEIAFHRYSRQFVDYYYGVPAQAALPWRPAYEGEPANGFSVGLAWGVRVTPNWLLTGAVDLERFDSGITGSPLVDDDDESRFTLQVSYDGDLFQAPAVAPVIPVSLDFGFAEIEAEGEDAAGDSLAYFEGGLRFGRRHRAAIGGFEATYARIEGPTADDDLRIRNLQLLYGYYVLDDRQKTVAVQAGVNFGQISSDGARALLDGSLKPMPMLALDGAAHFANRFSLRARLQLLLLDGERYSGRQMFASFGVFHHTFAKASLGIGYVFNRVALTSGEAELAARVEPLHQGPSLLLTASF
jgi:outer membrane scaffolding protein for murein synthesis (MipA/OmpV family)